MGALLAKFAAAGIRFEALDGDRLRAHGELSDELRNAIRAHKPAILAELAANAGRADAAHHWRVIRSTGETFEVVTSPPATLAELARMYPSATFEVSSAAAEITT